MPFQEGGGGGGRLLASYARSCSGSQTNLSDEMDGGGIGKGN